MPKGTRADLPAIIGAGAPRCLGCMARAGARPQVSEAGREPLESNSRSWRPAGACAHCGWKPGHELRVDERPALLRQCCRVERRCRMTAAGRYHAHLLPTPSGTTDSAIHIREAAAQPREVGITRTEVIPWRRLGQALPEQRMQHDRVCGAVARWCFRLQRKDLVHLRKPRPRQDSKPIRCSGFYFAARWV